MEPRVGIEPTVAFAAGLQNRSLTIRGIEALWRVADVSIAKPFTVPPDFKSEPEAAQVNYPIIFMIMLYSKNGFRINTLMYQSIYNNLSFKQAKGDVLFDLVCAGCRKDTKRTKRSILNSLRLGITNLYCSRSCAPKTSTKKNRPINTACTLCNKQLSVYAATYNRSKTKRFFCNKSCAATYNNTYKQHGTRVSKLEKWLQEKLSSIYPELEIHYNRKDAVNSELDIFIPEYKLAFELNGIFHYEPIYGKELLMKAQNNDHRKMQACHERNIELCIIDTSSQTYFKESTSIIFLNIITKIIDKKKADFNCPRLADVLGDREPTGLIT